MFDFYELLEWAVFDFFNDLFETPDDRNVAIALGGICATPVGIMVTAAVVGANIPCAILVAFFATLAVTLGASLVIDI